MTGKICKLLLQSLMMLLALNSFAQNKTVKVSGIVSDSFGPVAGATVYEKGNTSNGVIAGTDGSYSISVKADAILVFTCLGYADVEEAVSGRSAVDVAMKESFETLSAAEVVSIGYGSVARRDLTGSVAKVNMDDIVKSTNLNFDQALQGRVAGMVVTTSDGQVGAEANIIIRGNNSLTQSSAPLYVIDGFPTESSFAAALNPADIESVDVLKDASASAIYGARGANGVIVITTKRGNLGKPKVSFNASWTGSTLARETELLDGYEFVRLHSEWAQSRNGTTGNIYFSDYDANGVLSYNRYTLEDYKDKPYVDWQDYVYRNALSQNYNVSVAGGSKASGTMYNVSLSSQDQNGILINSNYKRYTGKFALSQEFGDRLTLDVNASYSYNETNGITPTSSASASVITTYFMYMVWGFRPTRPLRYGLVDDTFRNELVDNEVVATEGFRFNPAASVQNEYSKKRQDLLTANAAFTWKMAEGLKLRVSAGYTLNQRRNEDFNGSNTRTGHPGSPVGYGPNATIAWTRDAAWINENIL
ncbi:MAG: SusC/RagA family TonB-linked outer membrane protein, partial [Bacteroidales bacterium]|nr:SusC/RagA family TonB-linked outer membrane protein [Bacteroidales bacterium]